jgi:hypothetical protein
MSAAAHGSFGMCPVITRTPPLHSVGSYYHHQVLWMVSFCCSPVSCCCILLPKACTTATRDSLQEVQILSRVRHPNIVRFYGGSISPPNVFIVEELMQQDLSNLIHVSRAPLTLDEVLRCVHGPWHAARSGMANRLLQCIPVVVVHQQTGVNESTNLQSYQISCYLAPQQDWQGHLHGPLPPAPHDHPPGPEARQRASGQLQPRKNL